MNVDDNNKYDFEKDLAAKILMSDKFKAKVMHSVRKYDQSLSLKERLKLVSVYSIAAALTIFLLFSGIIDSLISDMRDLLENTSETQQSISEKMDQGLRSIRDYNFKNILERGMDNEEK